MIRLRGHHLVCLHYYNGGGLTEAYAANLKQKVEQAKQGESIVIAGGPDDVCAACPYLQGSLCKGTAAEEAEILQLDRQALALTNSQVGEKVMWAYILDKVKSAPPFWFESFCSGCTWVQYCDRGIKR